MNPPRELPLRAADTSAEQPWPVRLLSAKIGEYVEKMSALWVEGQVVQLTRRGGASYCYLTLRDTDVDMSLSVSIPTRTLDAMAVPLRDGARVVVHVKPTFWPKRGTLQMDARQIRPVGEGELLARLEHLKRVLASEGLFDRDRKQALPFLPNRVGLVCGRNSAAERDVVENARHRWPAIRFDIREVPVQGNDAVVAVTQAVQELDAAGDIDVIVVTRGGGSFEDLLPFSNEALIRAVARVRTPLVSAIGHDVDTPLLDFVADVRASTPTDAAKRIVPDVHQEADDLAQSRQRLARSLSRRLGAERTQLAALRSRPVLASPHAMLAPHRRELQSLRERTHRVMSARFARAQDEVTQLRARVRALSPLSTLERGYAVVQHADGRVVMDRVDVDPTDVLRVRVARGDFGVRPVTSVATRTSRAPAGVSTSER